MSYVLFYIWTGILVCMTLVTLIFTLFWGLCVDNQRRLDRPCIDFTQFGIYFLPFKVVVYKLTDILILDRLDVSEWD